jgi:hypothetical protein
MFAALTVAAFVVALGGPAFAEDRDRQGPGRRHGLLQQGQVQHRRRSQDAEETKDCAIGCAKDGQPLALLTADGKVYQIAGGLAADKNAKLIAHVSHTVEVTGDVMDHGGGKMMITADSLKMILEVGLGLGARGLEAGA